MASLDLHTRPYAPTATTGWIQYLPLAMALAMRLASEPTANLSYLVLAGYAFFGRPHLIRALLMSWFFTMINPGLAPDPEFDTVGRYAVLFASAFSAFAQNHFAAPAMLRSDRLAGMTVLLGAFIVVHAWLFSSMVDVSVLKGISWTVAIATCISAWGGLSHGQRRSVASELFWGLAAVLVVSVPLAATSVGYLRNGTGLQGVLNHPQVFGPAMALLFAWATARLLGEARPPWRLLAISGLSLAAVFLSEARTAGLAAAMGLAAAGLAAPPLVGRSILELAPGLRSARIWALMLIVFLAALIMSTAFTEYLQYYITKSGRAGTQGLWDAYELSRGRQMESMLANINQFPWTGLGFGIASEPDLMVVSRDPIFGLPLGAAIEKGVVPLMVVEELGIVGAGFVALWALRLFRTAARGGLAPFAVALTVLFINFGEATVFSPSGFGLLSIILLGWAFSTGQRHRGVLRG